MPSRFSYQFVYKYHINYFDSAYGLGEPNNTSDAYRYSDYECQMIVAMRLLEICSYKASMYAV